MGNIKLPVNEIEIGEGLTTDFDEEAMNEIVEFTKNFGISTPVKVIVRDGKYVLVGGARRFEAAKRVGLTEIEAEIVDIEKIKEELDQMKDR